MSESMSLRRHLIDELRDLLDAEQQLTRALPQLASAAAAPALKQAFQKHHQETERHRDRIDQALRALGEPPRAKRCVGMRGLIAEGHQMMGTAPKGPLRDAIMISGAQRVEHYEMAAYGSARTYAEVLGRTDVARLLDDTLREEKAADQKLSEIAEGSINRRAAEVLHEQGTGILGQSAEWMGQAAGAVARTVGRAADAVGLGTLQPADAVDAVRTSVADTAEAVVKEGRKLGKRAVRTARSAAADIMPAAKRRPARKAARRNRPAHGKAKRG